MIIFQDITKRYGPRTILDQVSFSLNDGVRCGIVGPNGAGKSTLFRLICGEEETDKGELLLPGNPQIGHLTQQLPSDGLDKNLLDFTLSGCSDLLELEQKLNECQESLGDSSDEQALQKLGDLQHEFEHRGGYELQSKAEAALGGLGFAAHRFSEPLNAFSGGWQMRAQLARVLLAEPDILLLDEPSNYLDLPAVEWLKRHLERFPGSLLLISHDRALLRSLAREILEVSHGRCTRFPCGFDRYRIERKERMEQQEARWRSLQKEREEIENFIRRFRAQASKASLVQSRIKQLEKMEPLPELEKDEIQTLIQLPDAPHSGHELLRLDSVGHHYPDADWLFNGLDLSIEKGERLALVGFNGMGKSTLLKIMAGRLSPANGKRTEGHQLKLGYQSQDFADTLPPDQSVFRLLREAAGPGESDTQLRSLLGRFGFRGDDSDKPAGVLSGGEKIRLAFARIFSSPPNLLLLDEPTTHLDLQGREALEAALQAYNGTVVLVSHDIEFVRNCSQKVLSLDEQGLRLWWGGYDEYREKGSQGSPAAPSSEAAKPAKPVLDGKAHREKQKERRRLERRLEKLETQIEEKESRQAELMQVMASGEVEDYATIQKELSQLAGEIQSLTREWSDLGEELEQG